MEGNIFTDTSHVARQILEADLNNWVIDLPSLSNIKIDPNFKCSNELPLNNLDFLIDMKDRDKCKDKGTVIYLEFDIENTKGDYDRLKELNNDFLNGFFTFKINVY